MYIVPSSSTSDKLPPVVVVRRWLYNLVSHDTKSSLGGLIPSRLLDAIFAYNMDYYSIVQQRCCTLLLLFFVDWFIRSFDEEEGRLSRFGRWISVEWWCEPAEPFAFSHQERFWAYVRSSNIRSHTDSKLPNFIDDFSTLLLLVAS